LVTISKFNPNLIETTPTYPESKKQYGINNFESDYPIAPELSQAQLAHLAPGSNNINYDLPIKYNAIKLSLVLTSNAYYKYVFL
jgi:hypothetical protein